MPKVFLWVSARSSMTYSRELAFGVCCFSFPASISSSPNCTTFFLRSVKSFEKVIQLTATSWLCSFGPDSLFSSFSSNPKCYSGYFFSAWSSSFSNHFLIAPLTSATLPAVEYSSSSWKKRSAITGVLVAGPLQSHLKSSSPKAAMYASSFHWKESC